LKFNAATRTRLLVDVTLDVDPTGSTVSVQVDGTWYAAAWQGSPVQRNVQVNGVAVPRWQQTARTTGYFAGPAHATPAGATVLALGRHADLKSRVVVDGDDLVNVSPTAIDVA
jgi:hypothetical protein